MNFRIIKPLYKPSEYIYSKNYRGSVKSLVFDWSGTLIDKYSIIPINSMKDTFQKHNINIKHSDFIEKFGTKTDIHIKNIINKHHISEKWKINKGKYPNDNDIQTIYDDYIINLLDHLENDTVLISDSKNIINMFQNIGIKIGITTNYNQEMVKIILKHITKHKINIDSYVTTEQVSNNIRPEPFMIYKNLDNMNIYPIQSVVKVDSTIFGIQEALEAGCWSIAVTQSSVYMNIENMSDEKYLKDNDFHQKLQHSRNILLQSGAHYVINTIKELPEVIDDINCRIYRGEKP